MPKSTPSRRLAGRACEHCRTRKLRCSRERPKCGNCRPWPGPCNYEDLSSSTTSEILGRERPCSIAQTRVSRPNYSNEERIDILEASMNDLKQTVAHLTSLISERPQLTESFSGKGNEVASDSQETDNVEVEGDRAFLGRSNAISLLDDDDAQRDQAREVARDFSTTHLGTHDFQRHRACRTYFIPSQETGDVWLRELKSFSTLGEGILSSPPEELLPKLIFHPDTVNPPGWVLWANCLLASSIKLKDDHSILLRDRLRSNIWCALNDARITLQPSECNIQALMLLAAHGDDFASPSLSWTLVGHACRLAQAIGLHVPDVSNSYDAIRKMNFFWSLFIVDKSVSLAFGRSPALPGHIYGKALETLRGFPNIADLNSFAPHTYMRVVPGSSDISYRSHSSLYGARHFQCSLLLSKLMEQTYNLVEDEGESCDRRAETENLVALLEDFLSAEVIALSDVRDKEAPVCTARQLKELDIGIASIKFQFHHLQVVLLREFVDSDMQGRCLRAARDALSLLPELISTSEQVYNGLIWQLIYFPINPFLVVLKHTKLFGELSDLALLRSTVVYYRRMAEEVPTASKILPLVERYTQAAEVKHQSIYSRTDIATEGATATRSWNARSKDHISSFHTPSSPNLGGVVLQQQSTESLDLMDDAFDWILWDQQFLGNDSNALWSPWT